MSYDSRAPTSQLKKLDLYGYNPQHITELLKKKNNSIWVGKVKRLELKSYAVGILPKLKLHEENVMEEIVLDACRPEHITELRKTENKSIWIRKTKKLELRGYAVGILPKLRIHGENVMEKLILGACHPEYLTEALITKDKSIWIGKVKEVRLEGLAKEIENKLDFTLIEPDVKPPLSLRLRTSS
ncbi:MAG: uncharacterized protein A8A55_3116 [Amphiamblys sp. WSBS2006]|nr:MAG: uncharacterized protein A8A55_3116 [Amphiamblys sp. WSBS2006]